MRGLNEIVSRMICEVRRKEGEERGKEDKEKEKKKVKKGSEWKKNEGEVGIKDEEGGRKKNYN